MICISYKHTNRSFKNYPKLSLDEKIELFEAIVEGWHLNIAECMIKINEDKGSKYNEVMRHCSFAVLSVILNYFEMIAKYKYYPDNYKEIKKKVLFRTGLEDVYPNLKGTNCAEILYKDVRNALYHSGVANVPIRRDKSMPGIIYDKKIKNIVIDPHSLVRDIKRHFKKYITELKKLSEKNILAKNFETFFDLPKK